LPREQSLRNLSFLGVLVCMAGMVTSPAMLSVGMAILIIPGVLLFPIQTQLQRFWAHRPAVLMSGIFFLELVSGIWSRSSGVSEWLEGLKIKAPLFLGMYSLAVIGPFSTKQVRIALGVLLLGTFVVGTATVIDYMLHSAEIDQRIQTSKEVQVWLGCNHIYFSVIMAFSILGGVWSMLQPGDLWMRGERYIVMAMVIACFLEMHVLTTRTGLVGFYLTALVLGCAKLLRDRSYLLAMALVLSLCSLPVAGYFGLSSFRHRMDNSIMDVTRYFRGKDPNYLSIGTRIESWKTAIQLWKKHPLIGVGMADLETDMTAQYVEDRSGLCPENFQKPHNQFLQNLVGWGIIGFLWLCLAWFYPAFSVRWPKNLIFWMFWVNYGISMMGESMMERQRGVSFLVITFMLTLGVGGTKKANPKAFPSQYIQG
jgi:O-antigen ligase